MIDIIRSIIIKKFFYNHPNHRHDYKNKLYVIYIIKKLNNIIKILYYYINYY